MIVFRQANKTDFRLIRAIAFQTWPLTYGAILSEQQLDFMLNKFYSLENLKLNSEQNQLFYIILENEIALGFLGIEHQFGGNSVTKIHKIYILSNNQGKGIGKLAIDFVTQCALENKMEKLILNVNRFNKAVSFYHKMDFKIVQEIDIEIGNGYLMEDFVMQMQL